MKIAYLIDEDLGRSSGVRGKIADQMEIWRHLGHQTELFSSRNQGNSPQTLLGKAVRHLTACRGVLTQLEAYHPDVIYTRYIKFAPGFARGLRRIAPYVIEINSSDEAECRLRGRFSWLYNHLTRAKFLSEASALVAVTHELANAPDFASFSLPTTVIANGYNFENHTVVSAPGNARPALLFVGSAGMPWHGVDKILRMARCLSEFDFHIVGLDREEHLNSDSPNLIWHGYLAPVKVSELIRSVDVAISSLALHRNGMNDACPLKSRQYLAYGTPVIIGYVDPDLGDMTSGVLNIGNHERNVETSMDAIRDFVIACRGLDRLALQASVKTRIDMKTKEARRVEFLATILSSIGAAAEFPPCTAKN